MDHKKIIKREFSSLVIISMLLVSTSLMVSCSNSNDNSKTKNHRKHSPADITRAEEILKREAVRVVKNSDFDFLKRKTLGYTLFKLDEKGEVFEETVKYLESIPVEKRNKSDQATIKYLRGLPGQAE